MPIPHTLAVTIAAIPPPLSAAPFRAHLDTLTKPLGSLGRLEDLATQLHTLGISHLHPAAYVFAADHGLTAEPISAYPAAVTRQMVLNFLAGGAAINVLARQHAVPLHIVNCGVIGTLPDSPNLTNTPIRQGSRNSLYEPANNPTELQAALELGLIATDANLIIPGEMGIGNTSAAALITAVLTQTPIDQVTGTGTGLNPTAHTRKIEVLRAVLAHHGPIEDPIEILRTFGGLEIAAMTAIILASASRGAAILLDGFISTAAAAIAAAIAPQVLPYLIAGHQSYEPGHRILLNHLNLTPILTLDMRLGEGTGALLAIPILRSALALYSEMATFQSAAISEATP